jgi:hypothetical protein
LINRHATSRFSAESQGREEEVDLTGVHPDQQRTLTK